MHFNLRLSKALSVKLGGGFITLLSLYHTFWVMCQSQSSWIMQFIWIRLVRKSFAGNVDLPTKLM